MCIHVSVCGRVPHFLFEHMNELAKCNSFLSFLAYFPYCHLHVVCLCVLSY
jgi:hypothetical protein